MSDDRIDAVIAEFKAEESASVQEADAATKEASQETQPEEQAKDVKEELPQDGETPEEPSDDSDEDVKFPKKAVKALARRDKKIGKLSAELEHLQNQVKLLSEANNPKQQNTANSDLPPSDDDFDTWEDYQRALIRYELGQATKNQAPPEQQQFTQEQIEQYNQQLQLVERIKVQETELLQTVPDYYEIEAEYQDVIDSASPELLKLFFDLDNPPLAFVTLAKQGKLESLLEMPLHKAALEIGKSLAQGLPQPKRVSNAPAPITKLTGTGSTQSPLNMSDTQFMQWLKNK
jgi:hypothetical protein